MRILVLNAILSLGYIYALAHYGKRLKPLPLWQECLIWGVLAFALTLDMVKELPWICRLVHC